MQRSLLGIDEHLPGGAQLKLLPGFLASDQAAQLLDTLIQSAAWRQDNITLFGRQHRIPRLHQWFGDPGSAYSWSGITMQPQPWLPELAELRDSVSHAAGERFNSVLVNYYRDGRDNMGWHADDERELGSRPVIASVSLGAERDFVLRFRDRMAQVDNVVVALPSGSLLIMAGTTQQYWQHCLPKRLRVAGPRINLTFRRIIPLQSAQQQ